MDRKLKRSESREEVLTSLAEQSGVGALVDYDGAPLSAPQRYAIIPQLEVDSTQCLFPITVDVDPSVTFPLGKRNVPCGHCEDCLRRRRNQWFFRIKQEAKSHILNYFITLTYDDDSISFSANGTPKVDRQEIVDFLKRLRKRLYPNKIRYFGIAEYGPETFRPHYHIIVFNWPYEYDAYGKDFKAPKPDGFTTEPISREEKYRRYYAKKAKRRAKLDGKL